MVLLHELVVVIVIIVVSIAARGVGRRQGGRGWRGECVRLQKRGKILKYVGGVHFVVELVGEHDLEGQHAEDKHGEEKRIGALLVLLRVHLMVLPHHRLIIARHYYGEYDDVQEYDERYTHDYPQGYEHEHPGPRDRVVEAECHENELEYVESAEELHFVGAIVAHRPYACAYGDEGEHEQGYEADGPRGVIVRVEFVAHDQLEEKENEVRCEADDHRFVLYERFALESRHVFFFLFVLRRLILVFV